MEVQVTQYGGADVLKAHPAPDAASYTLEPNEVLVENTHAGINFIDTYYRSGLYKKPKLPYVPGEEGAGVVVRAGTAVAADMIGKRVAYFGALSASGDGSYGRYTVVRSAGLAELPAGVSNAQGAALMCQGLTAHYLVTDSYPIGPGSIVVVHAAAGGTGLLVCQMAKLRGAEMVIGVCGGAEKAELAKRVGKADYVIDYKAEPDWAGAVRKLLPQGRQGVDAVLDGVGQSTFRDGISILRPRGYMITFGNASGAVEPIAPLDLMRAGSVYLQRPNLSHFIADPVESAQRSREVFSWVADGKLTLTIGKIWPLSEAREAQEALQGQKTTGKQLLDCTKC